MAVACAPMLECTSAPRKSGISTTRVTLTPARSGACAGAKSEWLSWPVVPPGMKRLCRKVAWLTWDEMRCDAMRCDGMGWDGMGWDGMG
jgi:hypothetical protein